MTLELDISSVYSYIPEGEFLALSDSIKKAHGELHGKTGQGSEYTGWLSLPADYDRAEFERILAAAEKIQRHSEVLVVIGIGGSYLGARAGLDALMTPFYNEIPGKKTPDIYFAGNSLSSEYLNGLIRVIGDRDFSVNVVSKSGTTTEPAVAFRIFRDLLTKKYGKDEAAKRIFATTDKARGSLKGLCDREGIETFVIPDEIGGRYSVLTAVGLLPFAVAGIDIKAMMSGATTAYADYMNEDVSQNSCYSYAAARHLLYRRGRTTEIFVSYEPSMASFNEWLKQLFGESEGKERGGIFPASVSFTTDLHSMGQYIQDGMRNLFETVLWFGSSPEKIVIEHDPEDVDKLNFLVGKDLHFVNEMAFWGTKIAHESGDVPNIVVRVSEKSAYTLGYLFYFFEKACAICGYLGGINPFDQPGVESYKKNMFALLGKPGYEKQRAEILKKLPAVLGPGRK